MNKGYIKVHRQLLEWEWYSDINVRLLFLHCLLLANHETKRWQGTEIKAGQFVTSLENLAIGCGLTIRQVRTAINKLKMTNELTSKTTSQYSMITINNWNKWQTNDKQNDKQMTNERQTNDKQMTTNKNEKNEKNEKNIFFIGENQKKSDPFVNPIKEKFKNEYKKVFGYKPFLSKQDCERLYELSLNEDFEPNIETALTKLKDITFEFKDKNIKPKVNWLLKDNHFSEVLNDEYKNEEASNWLKELINSE